MSLRMYKNRQTGQVLLLFESEESKLPGDINNYRKLPPNPSTILATSVYMTDFPQLDSMKSMYELDRILNIEAEQEREDKAYQELVTQI